MDDLDRVQLDIFQEIGNIGAGNAATALATMLNRKINMKVPNVSIVPFTQITDILDGPETVVAGVMIGMRKDLVGSILLVQHTDDANKLISLALDAPYDPDKSSFDEMELSVIKEIGNILVGSYLSAISGLTGLTIDATPPELCIDMAGAIMSVLVVQYGEIGDKVLFLETEFGDEDTLRGHFFLIPDIASYNKLLDSLTMGM